MRYLTRFKPNEWRHARWNAIADDGEWQEGDPIGLGETELAAITELLVKLNRTGTPGLGPIPSVQAPQDPAGISDGLPGSTPPSSAEPVAPIRADLSEELKEAIRRLLVPAVDAHLFASFPNFLYTKQLPDPPEWLTRMLASPDPPNQQHGYWPRAPHQREDDDL